MKKNEFRFEGRKCVPCGVIRKKNEKGKIPVVQRYKIQTIIKHSLIVCYEGCGICCVGLGGFSQNHQLRQLIFGLGHNYGAG